MTMLKLRVSEGFLEACKTAIDHVTGQQKCRRPSSRASVVTFEAAARCRGVPAQQAGSASGVVRAAAPLSLASRCPGLLRRRCCVTEDGRRVSCRRCRSVHYDVSGRRFSSTAVAAVCGRHPFSLSAVCVGPLLVARTITANTNYTPGKQTTRRYTHSKLVNSYRLTQRKYKIKILYVGRQFCYLLLCVS